MQFKEIGVRICVPLVRMQGLSRRGSRIMDIKIVPCSIEHIEKLIEGTDAF
jgi:hypothetical protein